MSEGTAEAQEKAAGGRFDAAFDCNLINLARARDRLLAFHQANGGAGIVFKRFDAVDGSALSPDEAVARGAIKPKTKFTKGAIGAALSHRTLWERAVETGRPQLIVEDDAYLRADITIELPRALTRLPGPYDVVFLGCNTDALLEFSMAGEFGFSGLFTLKYPKPDQLARFARTTGPVNLARLTHAFGLCATLVSPAGAAKLIERCFPMDNRELSFPSFKQKFPAYSIDGMMNAVFKDLAAYVAIPPLVLPGNEQGGSSTTDSLPGGSPFARR